MYSACLIGTPHTRTLPTIMRTPFVFFLVLFATFTYGQSEVHREKFKQLEPDVWMGLWDQVNSSKTFQIDSISYDELPKYLEFRGTVLEALRWTDNLGENILVLTVTGDFYRKEYHNDSSYYVENKSELYAYLFVKCKEDAYFHRAWKMYDYNNCWLDWATEFIPKATTITDLDNDGISEITIPYVLICRGGMDPGTMKIISYEGTEKYALRGRTEVFCNSSYPGAGKFKSSDNLKDNTALSTFLQKHWDRNKCEEARWYN